MTNTKQSGFTLVEIAIVLLIVTILLGYTMAMVPIQQELKQYRQADAEMNKITDALYAFAQVNGYLPCPAWANDLATPTVSSDGYECRDDNSTDADCDNDPPENDKSCDVWYGYVPAKTLGIEGKYAENTGLLLDPWGKPYRYQVAKDANAETGPGGVTSSGKGNFVILGDMAKAGMAKLLPDLSVCHALEDADGDPITPTSCGDPDNKIVEDIPIVILSTGKDAGTISSAIQLENLDNSDTDTVFVKTTRIDTDVKKYDDLVKWLSPNILYSKMIEAGQLP